MTRELPSVWIFPGILKRDGWAVAITATASEPIDAGSVEYVPATKLAELGVLLKCVLNSDMAMREEDEGQKSEILGRIRAALSPPPGTREEG